MPVDDAFWDDEAQILVRILASFFERAGTEAAQHGVDMLEQSVEVDIGVNWALVNENVIRWVNQRAANATAQIISTTRASFETHFEDWVRSGAPLDDLIDAMAPDLGRDRAERIAVTEVTNVFAEGNVAAWSASGMVAEIEIETAEDELVCPICWEKVDHNPYLLDDPDARPAFHTRCRCWLRPIVNIGTTELPASDATGGSPTDFLSTANYSAADDDDRPRGAFESERVHLEGDGFAIRKPASDSMMYNMSKREAWAYEVDQRLGLNLVPPTAYRETDNASFQQMIEGAVNGFQVTPSTIDSATGIIKHVVADNEQFGRMGLLDAVLGNTDRHPGNFLVDKSGTVYAIDHGLSAGTRIAPNVRRLLAQVFNHAEEFGGWGNDLMQLPLSSSFRDALEGAFSDGALETLARKYDLTDIQITRMNARVQELLEKWAVYFTEP